MPTTEIVTCPLKAGSAIGDPENQASAIVRDVNQTIMQQDGCQQIHFGMQVESPHVIQMMVDWRALEDHHKFMEAEHYRPFVQSFMVTADDKPVIWHADFKPEGALNRTLSAPVTEIATFYFDGQPPEGYLDQALQFADLLEKEKAEGYLSAALGVTHETIEREGVKGKGAVLAIGWSSVDAHMQFRQTQLFKDNIHLLRQNAAKIEMHHVQFMNFVAE